MRAAKILIGNEKIEEAELDEKFIEVFTTMCEHEIPIWGFFNDEIGQWMYGPMTCFQEVFAKQYAVIGFNVEAYLEEMDGPVWFAHLDKDEPMKSKLYKYKK